MMVAVPKKSAGVLAYRVVDPGVVEVLIVHPGGPFWASKDAGAWSIPKGEYAETDDAYSAALREFTEEVGQSPPGSEPLSLGELTQPGGKRVMAWALEGDVDLAHTTSNTFEMEWPRGSGNVRSFPEVDRVEWMTVADAQKKLLKGQAPFLDRLLKALGFPQDGSTDGSEGATGA
jgi:predicted NUDIX family NTP pyrophosphohydrolase